MFTFQRDLSASVMLTLLVFFAAAPAQADNVQVVVPQGIVLEAHLLETMDSSKVHTGDVFQFVAAKDVVVDMYIAISSGPKHVGHFTDAHSAGSHGKWGGVKYGTQSLPGNSGEPIFAPISGVVPKIRDTSDVNLATLLLLNNIALVC